MVSVEVPGSVVTVTEPGSSFQRCMGYVSTLERRLSEIGSELSSYGESLAKSNTIVIITNPLVEHRMPSFLKLVINVFLYILRSKPTATQTSARTKLTSSWRASCRKTPSE